MAAQPLAHLDAVVFAPGGHALDQSPDADAHTQPRADAASALDPDTAFELRVPSLSIRPGEVLACIGPSGSGKTTLLNLIAGIALPDAGSVRVLGHDLAATSEAQRRRLRLSRLGLVFQEFELLEYISAWENITLAARLGRQDRRALASQALALARAADIEHALARRPHALSQGERQRVAVCRALATAPALILCDEPTGNLDPDSAAAITSLLLAQARALGAGLLMVTHNHALLPSFDRILRLETSRRAHRRIAVVHEAPA